MLLKLTLDTNCIINLLDYNAATATSVDALTELMRHAVEGKVQLCVTSALSEDLTQDSNDERRREMLQKASMFPVIGGIFRFEASKLDGPDVLASEEQAQMFQDIQSLLFPGLANDTRDSNERRDVAHLVAHKLKSRDIFVTDDKKLLRKAQPLLDEYRIEVMTPEEAVARLERTVNLALVAEDFRGRFDDLSRLMESAAESGKWTEADQARYEKDRAFLVRTFPKIQGRLGGHRQSQGEDLLTIVHTPNPFHHFYADEEGHVAANRLLADAQRNALLHRPALQILHNEAGRLRTLLLGFVGALEG